MLISRVWATADVRGLEIKSEQSDSLTIGVSGNMTQSFGVQSKSHKASRDLQFVRLFAIRR